MKIALCEMDGVGDGGGRGMNYGTISRQQLAQLAATPGGPGRSARPERTFAVTCCSFVFTAPHQCFLNHL